MVSALQLSVDGRGFPAKLLFSTGKTTMSFA